MKGLGKAVPGGALLLTMLARAGWADSGGDSSKNSVRWETIVGVIQAGNVVGGNSAASPPIPKITGDGQPWSTLEGRAYVDLSNSVMAFRVKRLVLAGGNSIGTPGTVTTVKGTLICNHSTASQTIIDTPSVTLDAQGNASFYGGVTSATAGCSASAVAFLIRVPANNHWIANGAVQVPFP
jgi:hypothetical protein